MNDRIWFAQLLRGVAALIVLYRHLAVGFWLANAPVAALAGVAALDAVPDLPHLALTRACEAVGVSGGPLGVAVFFLISGFVIPFSLERLGPRRFLLQRAFRLYPTYAVGLAFTCAAMAAYALAHGTPLRVRPLDYLMNLSLCRDWLGGPGIDGIVWTLEVELKFYLLCAALCLVSSLRSAATLVGASSALAAACWLAPRPLAYPLPVVLAAAPFLAYMLLGTCLFNHQHGHWSAAKTVPVAAAIAAASALCHVGGRPAVTLRPDLFFGSYGLALVLFVLVYALQRRVPRSAALDWLANVSYPLYVVHGVAGYVLLTVLMKAGCPAYAAIALAMGLALAAAHALHHLVEKPSLRLAKWAMAGKPPAALPATRRAA